MDVLTQFAWIIWLVLILVFATVEVFTLELTFLMLGLGSLAGLASGLFGLPWWAQFLVAAVVALALLFGLRPSLLRRLRGGVQEVSTNVAAIVGTTGSVLQTVSLGGGQVKLQNGETWTARLSSAHETQPGQRDEEIAVGRQVRVTAVDGATVVVLSDEGSAL